MDYLVTFRFRQPVFSYYSSSRLSFLSSGSENISEFSFHISNWLQCAVRRGQAVHSSNSLLEQLPAFFHDSRVGRKVVQQSSNKSSGVQALVLANLCPLEVSSQCKTLNSFQIQAISEITYHSIFTLHFATICLPSFSAGSLNKDLSLSHFLSRLRHDDYFCEKHSIIILFVQFDKV